MFVIKRNKQHYWFVQKGRNGKIITTSETYVKKQSALKGILAIMKGFYDPATAKAKLSQLVVDETV